MKKKILIGIVFLFCLMFVSSIAMGINTTKDDPINDVIVVPNFQYTFDLSKASIEDLDVIETIEYYHTSEKSGLDLIEIDIDEQGDNIEITFEINGIVKKYPYTGRSAFFIGIIILDENYDGFGAVHLKQSILEINKYAKYFNGEISGVGDFTYSHSENEIIFLIPSTVFLGVAEHIYAVVGEADINDIDVEAVKFTIENIRLDLYPNNLYGAKDSDYPENEDVDDKPVSDDSYTIIIVAGLAIISIVVIPTVFKKKN